MFTVKQGPKFMEGFDPEAPINRITAVTAEKAGTLLSMQIDTFVRQALAKVVSPETLAFFVETRMSIPEVDLVMTLNSPHSRTLEVHFKKNSIAKVTIDTILEDRGRDGVHIVHQSRDLVI